MSKILCVWELGEDLGHLGRFAPVVEELLGRGHEVTLVVKDLSRVEELTQTRPFSYCRRRSGGGVSNSSRCPGQIIPDTRRHGFRR